jgi:hypothetical protein
MPKPTEQQKVAYFEKLLNKFKQRPNFELECEFGRLLMIHIDDFTPEQRKRYDELKEILCKPQPEQIQPTQL